MHGRTTIKKRKTKGCHTGQGKTWYAPGGKTTESLSKDSALAKTQTELPPKELIYTTPM
jgi:hypothetical protein